MPKHGVYARLPTPKQVSAEISTSTNNKMANGWDYPKLKGSVNAQLYAEYKGPFMMYASNQTILINHFVRVVLTSMGPNTYLSFL